MIDLQSKIIEAMFPFLDYCFLLEISQDDLKEEYYYSLKSRYQTILDALYRLLDCRK